MAGLMQAGPPELAAAYADAQEALRRPGGR